MPIPNQNDLLHRAMPTMGPTLEELLARRAAANGMPSPDAEMMGTTPGEPLPQRRGAPVGETVHPDVFGGVGMEPSELDMTSEDELALRAAGDGAGNRSLPPKLLRMLTSRR